MLVGCLKAPFIIFMPIILGLITQCSEPIAQSNLNVVGGTEVTDQNDPVLQSTVMFLKEGRPWCTGTLIGPNQIISAGHCFNAEVNGFANTGAALGKHPMGEEVRITGALVHPK